MLAYPDAWWAKLLAEAGIGEWTRRYVHRTAAVVMIVASLVHLYWMLLTPYGRAELKRIAPKLRDVREVMQNMRYHLGSSRHRAAFAKYDYPAKAEYWALVWGTIVMALTGLILWFPIFTTSFAPYWTIKVAEVVHLFEAWLATLAILLFHFFYVFGHPEIYPLNFAMFHGGMREEHAEHEHPDWAREEEPREI
jgi:cytochrome b subunit of formate dehydrogenase